ncbi:hypothetical protein [Planktotalea sp.]|uniref:hypothetical protein n=1 Tax=Planktotalea sp. TaxID=2029877 RepID=UPI003297269F
MNKPILKGQAGQSAAMKSLSQQFPFNFGASFSKAADLYPHDIEGLIQILHFRNQVARAAKRRSSWFGGRFYNRFSGEDPDYIPLSGMHLRQTLSVLNIETPEAVVKTGTYSLRYDMSEEAVKRLRDAQG